MKNLYNKLKSLPRNKRDLVSILFMAMGLGSCILLIEFALYIDILYGAIILLASSSMFVVGLDLFQD